MTSDNPVCFSEYIDVNGVNTHVLKYDYDRKENLHQKDTNEHSKRCDVLVLLIPGNPGIVGFYEDFMLTLYDASSRRVPVWGISHAGHELTPGMNKRCCTWKHNEKLNLRGQVKHKVDFIKNHISPDTKVILIGHSIGCYIILEILKELPRLNVLKCVLLFPTIEGMWESPKGTWMAPFLVYLRWVAILPVYLASYLSPWVQWNLIQWYFKGRKVSKCTYNAVMNLFNPSCVSNQMYMAASEMVQVVSPDLPTIHDHISKLLFYYGATDHWCPVSYYHKMKLQFPDADIKLCEKGIAHAFCLESSAETAVMVWGWIQEDVSKIYQ